MDLATSIANIKLKVPIYNASGCWCRTKEELDQLLNSDSGAMVCKSSTLEPRDGNLEPRLYKDDPFGSINSMGVPNYGYKFYLDYGQQVNSNNYNKPYFQSIIPFSKLELVEMLTNINKINDQVDKKYLIEINLSCPNIVKKSIVAYDFEMLENYLKTINVLKLDNLILGIKLPPYNENKDFDIVSQLIINCSKIKFITCINSLVNGLIIDPETETTKIRPNNGLGGIGGSYCKPIALSNVFRFYQRLGDKLDVIGCGGVNSGKDVFEHILCGASAVQIGTQLVKEGPNVFSRINNELKNIMESKGYKKISDFKGCLKVI